MPSRLQSLKDAYVQLSSLYKNPTRRLLGAAASDQDAELAGKHAELLALFRGIEWGEQEEKSALYFKVLALLYEIDDYRGVTPAVERTILKEPTAFVEHFSAVCDGDGLCDRQEIDFSNPEVRTLWKAKVLCCVATVESKRKSSDSGVLLNDLNILEEFVRKQLHKPDEKLPAWTTLAFVLTAQARIARQREAYTDVRDKLLSVVECLDARAAEILGKLSPIVERFSLLEQLNKKTKPEGSEFRRLKYEIDALNDDLIFIRQKHTLTILFNVGLDNLQRGFLSSANQACLAAKFQFGLHGHNYHRLFNELLMLSIKRARMSGNNKDSFLPLEAELEQNIIPRLEPKGFIGNPKLYVYGLRELAVIQHVRGKSAAMRATLRKMEQITPLGPQWKSRISILHARARYVGWSDPAKKIDAGDQIPLLDALNYSEEAFRQATGSKTGGIRCHKDSEKLLEFVRKSGSRNLIDTIESLITYGTVQLFLKECYDAVGKPMDSAGAIVEAKKSALAVIELCGKDNPRLLAMGYLVLADAYRAHGDIIESRRHLETAKTLESRIEHKYVEDRRKAIEGKLQTSLILHQEDCKNIAQAEDKLLGWCIGNCEDKHNMHRLSKALKISRGKLTRFILRQGVSSPYYHLLPSSSAKKKRKRKR